MKCKKYKVTGQLYFSKRAYYIVYMVDLKPALIRPTALI